MKTGAVWFAVIAGITTVLVVLRVVLAKSSARRLDVGSVSTQWITEHRVESGNGVIR
jgi:hypothetical protein